MASILIKHQTGSKANQTETFDLANFREINFGRGDSVEVKYDDRDDLVSRQHAKITRDANNPNQFILSDSGSRNGIFFNRVRINSNSSVPINHGDRVQFGTGGPEFIFELDPPPTNSARETRIISDANNSQATREVPAGTREIQPRSEGRLTSLERKIVEERDDMEYRMNEERQALNAQLEQERRVLNEEIEKEKNASRWRLIYVATGLFCVGIIGAGAFLYHNMTQQAQLVATQQQLVATQQTVVKADSDIKAMKDVMTPQKINELYAKSTVFIESTWELVDNAGGKMYQVHIDKSNRRSENGNTPVYIEYKDKQGNVYVEPVPSYDAKEGHPFVGRGNDQGSGFAISNQGFILTNAHVVEPWKYLDAGYLNIKDGVVINYKTNSFSKLTQKQKEKLGKWNANDSLIFKDFCVLLKTQCKDKLIEGRNISLNVTFPKTTLPYPARLVRESNEADVALLKIDVLEPLQNIPSLDRERNVNSGEAVTVFGYPKMSFTAFVDIKSKDIYKPESKHIEVPEPTLTSGVVSKVHKIAPDTKKETENNYAGEIDAYQLAINSINSGNSGGPVFNDHGQVIGIFTYMGQEGVAYALPIKYGLALKMNQSELKE